MNKLVGVLISVLFVSCGSNNETLEKDQEIIKEDVGKIDSYKNEGYAFFEELNKFSLKGEREISAPVLNKKPFFAIKSDSLKVSIVTLSSDNENEKLYWVHEDGFMRTHIYEEDSDFQWRIVESVRISEKIEYHYTINNQKEDLIYIYFRYPDGRTNRYENLQHTYIDFQQIKNESDVPKGFKKWGESH